MFIGNFPHGLIWHLILIYYICLIVFVLSVKRFARFSSSLDLKKIFVLMHACYCCGSPRRELSSSCFAGTVIFTQHMSRMWLLGSIFSVLSSALESHTEQRPRNSISHMITLQLCSPCQLWRCFILPFVHPSDSRLTLLKKLGLPVYCASMNTGEEQPKFHVLRTTITNSHFSI